MNVSGLISRRLGSPSLTSKTSARVAIITIWVSVTIMVLALIITLGFRSEISKKTYASTGAIEITALNPLNVTSVNTPILDDEAIAEFNNVIAPQKLKSVVQAGGVLQNGTTNIGVALLSVEDNGIEGDDIKISSSTAKELGVEKGEKLDLVVMGAFPIRKRVDVVDIFSTGISEMERSMVFVSEDVARSISDIDSSSVSYYMIEKPIQNMATLVELCDDYQLTASSAEQRMPQIFDWLDMIDQNMVLVFIIMIIVAVIGIVSSTLIVILEHTPTIATLRAMGMRRSGVRMIFVNYMGRTMVRGVALGLATALGIGVVQMAWGVIKLDSESYFVDAIPIAIDWVALLYLIIGIVVVVGFAVVIPTAIISRMKIAESLKFS